MKKLSEHNTEQNNFDRKIELGSIKNGIACDYCGNELVDTRPNVILSSYPPQKSVFCDKCGFGGYRIA